MKKLTTKWILGFFMVLLLIMQNNAFVFAEDGLTKFTSQFNAYPKYPSEIDPDTTNRFLVKGTPGKTVSQILVIENRKKESIRFNSGVVAGMNGINGSVGYASKKMKDSWIVGICDHYELPAQTKTEIPFEIVVPNDTKDGEYVYGIELSSTQNKLNGDNNLGENQLSAESTKIYRFIMPVIIRVGNPKNYYPLEFKNADVIATPSGFYLKIDGINDNPLILRDLYFNFNIRKDNQKTWQRKADYVSLLGNGSPFVFQFPWENAPEIGKYYIDVEYHSKTIPTQTGHVEFEVKADVLEKQEELTGTSLVQSTIPMWMYGILFILMILIILLLFLLMKRKKEKQKNELETNSEVSSEEKAPRNDTNNVE